jgi:hypothetical protein
VKELLLFNRLRAECVSTYNPSTWEVEAGRSKFEGNLNSISSPPAKKQNKTRAWDITCPRLGFDS